MFLFILTLWGAAETGHQQDNLSTLDLSQHYLSPALLQPIEQMGGSSRPELGNILLDRLKEIFAKSPREFMQHPYFTTARNIMWIIEEIFPSLNINAAKIVLEQYKKLPSDFAIAGGNGASEYKEYWSMFLTQVDAHSYPELAAEYVRALIKGLKVTSLRANVYIKYYTDGLKYYLEYDPSLRIEVAQALHQRLTHLTPEDLQAAADRTPKSSNSFSPAQTFDMGRWSILSLYKKLLAELHLPNPKNSGLESAVLRQAARGSAPIGQVRDVVNHINTFVTGKEPSLQLETPTERAVIKKRSYPSSPYFESDYGLMRKAAGMFDQQQLRDPAWQQTRYEQEKSEFTGDPTTFPDFERWKEVRGLSEQRHETKTLDEVLKADPLLAARLAKTKAV